MWPGASTPSSSSAGSIISLASSSSSSGRRTSRDRPVEIFAQTLAFLGVQPWLPARFELRNAAEYTPIDRALGAELAERFAESNRRLARLLGRDLGWNDVALAAPR